MLPPSSTVFSFDSLYLGGLTFQFLRLPIGPLYHCHNNLEAFLLSQVIRTIWTIYQIKSPFPNSESQASNSFSGTVLLLKIKDKKFSCLQRCKDAPTFKSAKKRDFLRFFTLFVFFILEAKTGNCTFSQARQLPPKWLSFWQWSCWEGSSTSVCPFRYFLPNQIHQTKPKLLVKAVNAWVRSAFGNVSSCFLQPLI